ncbi:oligosaccharide flippase family protein [uncultured Sphingomonas sp.]|uniref:oligosaccharide flippase family protein n=1 Tax=uncultured Sphingomonas sp. TaxID=158754 RepID=UPI002608B274|nr:oligosaccharide flippase family protein [uncultured Sphingomonas sp.]
MQPPSPERDPAPAPNVRARAATGASTLVFVNLVSRGMGIFSIAVLARLLTPGDFGIVSLAMIVVEFAQMLTDFQLIKALLRHPGRDQHLYATAFTMAMLRGLLTAIGIALAAIPAALLLHNQQVRDVLLVLAIVPIIDGLRSPRMVDYLRDIDFSQDAAVTIIGRVAGLLAMIAVALATHSYWALVTGTVVASIAMTIATHWFKPFRPRLALRDYGLFLGFGGWMSAAAITNYASSKLDALIVAGRFSVARFGEYNLGMQISTIVTNQLADPFERAIFSALSSMTDDLPRRLRAYDSAQATILGVLLPIGFGMALVAHEAIMVVAGPKWADAIWVVRFVAPPMAIATVAVCAQALLMAEGDTRTVFIRNLIGLGARLVALWVGVVQFGLTGLLAGYAISNIFYLFLTLQLAARRFSIPLLSPFLLAWRSFAATGAMIAAVLAFDATLALPSGTGFIDNLAMLVAKGAIGGLTYAAAHMLLWLASGRPPGFERFMLDYIAHARTSVLRRFTSPA